MSWWKKQVTFDVGDKWIKGHSYMVSSESSFEDAVTVKAALESNGIDATALLDGGVLISPKDADKAERLLGR